MRAILIQILIALAGLCAGGCTPERAAVTPYDMLEPCKQGEGPREGLCGTLEVFEDREAASGRKIGLRILVMPALGNAAAPDPLFVLTGGPGSGAAAMAGDMMPAFARVLLERDVVFVDQRGTGESAPLDCEFGDDLLRDPEAWQRKVDEVWRACLASYDADLTKYTTPIAMDDLDDVRAYLGYERINLWGGSYGTRAALVYLRRHAERVRTVVLDGVAPTYMRLPEPFPRDMQRALDLLFAACQEDGPCRERFPDLAGQFASLLARFDAGPLQVTFVDPASGQPEKVFVEREIVASMIAQTLYNTQLSAILPLAVEEAVAGDYAPLWSLGAAYSAQMRFSHGMFYSVVCSEDYPRIDQAVAAREAAGTFAGMGIMHTRFGPCAYWPNKRMEEAYYEPVVSDVPALVLSGEADPVTPPRWGEEVASHLANSRHIVAPGVGHGTLMEGCVPRLIAEFLSAGSAAELDVACVQRIRRPPFFITPAGPDLGPAP